MKTERKSGKTNPDKITNEGLMDINLPCGRNQSSNKVDFLLEGYTMPWALNQTLIIGNTGERMKVNAYKMATQSTCFKELLRKRANQFQFSSNIKSVNSTKQTNELGDLTVYYDPNNEEYGRLDLLFAIYFCHLGMLSFGGIDGNAKGTRYKELVASDAYVFDENNVCNSHNPVFNLTPNGAQCSLRTGLRVAATYGLNELHKACLDHTKSILSFNTCWQLWNVATTLVDNSNDGQFYTIDQQFTQLVMDYIASHFHDLILNQAKQFKDEYIDFDDLNINQLETLLCADSLNIRKEGEVLRALRRWLESPKRTDFIGNRPIWIARLLPRCVRINVLDVQDVELLDVLLNHRLSKAAGRVRRRRETTTTIMDVSSPRPGLHLRRVCTNRWEYGLSILRQTRRELIRMKRNLRSLSESSHTMVIEAGRDAYPPARLPHEAIFIFGGWKDGEPCRDVTIYDRVLNRWNNYSRTDEMSSQPVGKLIMPEALMSFGITVACNRYVIIAGGETIERETSCGVISFDFESVSGWKQYPPLHDKRRDLVLVNRSEVEIYAIGGDNNRAVLNTVEYFQLDSESLRRGCGWTMAPGMIMARGAPSADCVNGIIYVCGGYTEPRMEALTNTCEAFNSFTNQWTMIQPMGQARYYATAVTVGNALYVLGGGGESELRGTTRVSPTVGYNSTVERYDPLVGAWEQMPPASPRADFAACLFEDELICLGGGGAVFCTDHSERWKPWLPNHGQAVGMEQLQRPAWLVESDNAVLDSLSNQGWRPFPRLPAPVWGHGGVVIHGHKLIAPFLNRRNVDEGSNSCPVPVKVIQAECALLNGNYILVSTCREILNDLSCQQTEKMTSNKGKKLRNPSSGN